MQGNTMPLSAAPLLRRPNRAVTSKIAVHKIRKARLGTLNHSDGFYSADDVTGSDLHDITGSALVAPEK